VENQRDKGIEALVPLSPSQQGMLLECLGSQPGLHVEQTVFSLSPNLNVAAFRSAWRTIIDRHAILRTAFVWSAKTDPVQVVLNRVEVPLTVEDWRGSSSGEQKQRMQAYLESDRELGFVPKRAPLLRLALFRTSDASHRFVLTTHHLLLDGWSLSVVLSEALTVYEANVRNQAAELPPVRPYREYISWLRAQDQTVAKEYWSTTLAGFKRATALGRELPFPEDPDSVPEGFGDIQTALSAETAATLDGLARQAQVTLSTLLAGIWGILLCAYGGNRDVLFGSTVSGRPPSLPGVLSMVGLFINTVPLRLNVPERGDLWHWLGTVQSSRAREKDFEHSSGGEIHRWSEVRGARALYDSVLVYENYPDEAANAVGASLSIDTVESRTIGARTSYPLTLLVTSRGRFSVRLIHRRSRIEPEAARTILAQFVALLEKVALEKQIEIPSLLKAIPDAEVPTVRAAPTSATLAPYVEARDAHEMRVVEIWKDVLHRDLIGVHDNFFELGGHSLLALDLMRRLDEQLGVRLPMSTLLENPTVERLAVTIRRKSDGRAWSPLVPIRKTGTGSPFFCVPGAAMDAISLYPLSQQIGEEHAFYGLQPQGLDGLLEPLRSIESMAAAVVTAMRAAQPEGPYYLGGHSFGGHVAFEAAQQLLAAGCAVGLLAIIDTEAAPLSRQKKDPNAAPRDDNDRLLRLLSLVQRFFGRQVSLALDSSETAPTDLAAYVAAKLAQAQILPVDMSVERIRSYLTVGEASSLAFDAYYPVYREPLPTLVFRARQTHRDDHELGLSTHGSIDDTLGWRALAGPDTQAVWVPGDHVTLMTEPNVRVVGERLHRALSETGAP